MRIIFFQKKKMNKKIKIKMIFFKKFYFNAHDKFFLYFYF
jgi:hypothetical protein